jgi:DNA-binding GntR family transcriptional regulator
VVDTRQRRVHGSHDSPKGAGQPASRRPPAGGPSGDGLRPVRRESTVGLVAEELRAAIRSGRLGPGTTLVEGALAAELGVSRGPLREAAQRLVAEGLLVSAWHRRLTVASPGPDEVRDLYTTRAALETAAWRNVLGRDREAAATRLTDVVTRMERAAAGGEPSAMPDLELEFHTTLADASASARLQRMLGTLLVESRLAESAEGCGQALHDLVPLHRAMVDALRAGDGPRLVRLHETHTARLVAALDPSRSAATET